MSEVPFAFETFGVEQENEQAASDISDFVSGRLDPLAARHMERRARTDGCVAAAIIDAMAVRRRVERRLKRRS